MLEPDLLRVFVATAERGGFTRAARSLNRTQSAVSAQIRRLEEAVGAELFSRGGGGREVRLTPAGERLIGYARRLLALGEEALGSVGGELAGTVRVGCIDDYATRVLPGILAGFWRAHPGVLVEVRTGLTTHLVERLGPELDLVLGMQPTGARHGHVLARDRPVWATSPVHAAHEETVVPLALYPEGCLFRRWAIDALDGVGRGWRCAYLSPSLGAVEAAVQAGLAVSVLKAATAGRNLRRLRPEDGFPALPEVEIVLHVAGGSTSRAATGLAEHIVACLGGPLTPSL